MTLDTKTRARRAAQRRKHTLPLRWRRSSANPAVVAHEMWELRCERCGRMACADENGYGGSATFERCDAAHRVVSHYVKTTR